MGSLRAHIALLLIGYGFLCVFVDRGEAQGGPGGQSLGQNQGQQQGGPQNMGTSANCPLFVIPGRVNNPGIASGGKVIMYQEPCKGFSPHKGSHKNSGRREGCRKAAYLLNKVAHRNDCPIIVHGQCIFVNATGTASCYALVRWPDGAFALRLLQDCADGRMPQNNFYRGQFGPGGAYPPLGELGPPNGYGQLQGPQTGHSSPAGQG